MKYLAICFALMACCFCECTAADPYGGNGDIQADASGFFRVEEINGRWLFVTPEGHGYFAMGANHVGKYLDQQAGEMGLLQKFGGDRTKAAQFLANEMKGMGLTAGEAYAPIAPELKNQLPWVANLKFPGASKFAFDVFDPVFQQRLRESVLDQCVSIRDDPWVLGIAFADLPVWDQRRIKFFEGLDPSTPGGQRLAKHRAAGKSDNEFLGLVADSLYGQLAGACGQAAPNHLFFGERHRLRGTPDEVLQSIGKHVDVFCTQALILSPQRPPEWQVFQAERYDYEQRLTGKPMMVIDWAAPFSLGEKIQTDRGTLFPEKRAADQAANWLQQCVMRPYMIGVFKCQLIGLHANDRWFDGKARRTYLQDDGDAFAYRTATTREAHQSALAAVYRSAMPVKRHSPAVVGHEFLQEHCIHCHDNSDAEGGLDLTSLTLGKGDVISLKKWAVVYDRIAAGEMPPEGEDRPDPKDTDKFLQLTASTLQSIWHQRYADRGRVGGRRLNPTEYENTMRDLLAAPWLELKSMLPPDPESDGFDNVADVQEISYVQLARYLEAAEVAIDGAMRLRPAPKPTTVRTWFMEEGRYLGKDWKERIGSLDARPEWKWFWQQPNSAQSPRRIRNTSQKIPGWYRFRVRCRAALWDKGELRPPEKGQVASINTAAKRVLAKFDVPEGQDGGIVEFVAWQRQNDLLEFFYATADDRQVSLRTKQKEPQSKRDAHEAFMKTYRGHGIAVDWFEIEGPFASESCEGTEVNQTWPSESYRRLFGDLPMAPWTESSGLRRPEPLNRPDLTANKFGLRETFQMPSEMMMVVSQNPLEDAERLLRKFMQRAYRRVPVESEVQRCLSFVAEAIGERACFQDAMRLAYKAALCSPDFLYFREPAEEAQGPAQEPTQEPMQTVRSTLNSSVVSDTDRKWTRLDGDSLASRLSYLLWRSMPDDELVEAARSGELLTDAGLKNQMDRMLKQSKAQQFISDFTGQWLDLRKVHETSPDRYLFPEYFSDSHVVDSAVEETEATFARMLHQNLPVKTIVEADFIMANERLASVYGIQGIKGQTVRYIKLPADSAYGGLLTQSSVMKVTANGLTTSPVLRGVWVMDRILGTPPAAPPPGVGSIEPDTRGATTVRDLLAKHSQDTSCASCHAAIDPPGFALENFDVMGKWRDHYRSFEQGDEIDLKVALRKVRYKRGRAVDSSGVTKEGQVFDGIHQFRRYLASQDQQLARNLTERFITFATGAGVTFADRQEVESILRETESDGYPIRSLLQQVILSQTFRSK